MAENKKDIRFIEVKVEIMDKDNPDNKLVKGISLTKDDILQLAIKRAIEGRTFSNEVEIKAEIFDIY